jgi:hypothetical protein
MILVLYAHFESACDFVAHGSVCSLSTSWTICDCVYLLELFVVVAASK